MGAVFALALAACGSSKGGTATAPGVEERPGDTGDPGGGGGDEIVPAPCPEVTVRIRGVSGDSVSALGLVLGQVAVSRGGAALPVLDAPLGATLDVAASPSLGRFALAGGDALVSVSISFSGGSATAGGVAGELGLCTAPIGFGFRPERLNPAWCRIEVVLNLDRTVVAHGGGLAFVPHYQVFF